MMLELPPVLLLLIVVSETYAPLFNEMIVTKNHLPFLLKKSCEFYSRYEVAKETTLVLAEDPLKALIKNKAKRKR